MTETDLKLRGLSTDGNPHTRGDGALKEAKNVVFQREDMAEQRPGFKLDTLAGAPSNGADIILGGAGNDILIGNRGDDVLYGQSGDDDLSGGRQTDICDGGTGTDTSDGTCETELNIP